MLPRVREGSRPRSLRPATQWQQKLAALPRFGPESSIFAIAPPVQPIRAASNARKIRPGYHPSGGTILDEKSIDKMGIFLSLDGAPSVDLVGGKWD
jgi:hypothetical protein